MTDGARNAMLGYLYQFSLVASLRAYSIGDYVPEDGWPTLIGMVAEGKLTNEFFNQDVVVSTDKAGREVCAAVQVKYSGDANVPINLQVFIELLFGFDQSKKLAERQRVHFDEYYVITNRNLDTSIDKVWRAQSAMELKKLLDSRKKQNKGIWPEWATKLFGQYSSEAAAISDWCTVLAKLQHPLFASYHHGLDQLKHFARRHGILEDELNPALNALFGQLVEETAAGRSLEITTGWLKMCLTGATDAFDLSFRAQNQMLASASKLLRQRLDLLTGPNYSGLTRRRLAEALSDEVERHPVTFVCGRGGSGKSVICIQHLLSFVDGPLGLSVHSSDVTRDFLTESLRRLRSRTPNARIPHDPFERAMTRLIGANAGSATVLIVDIDAVDEADPSLQGEIRRLVRLFLEPGEHSRTRKLLVSCRPRRKRSRLRHGLIREWVKAESPEYYENRIGVLEIDDFDTKELEEADSQLNNSAENRLFRSAPLETIEGAAMMGGGIDLPSSPPLSLLKSLHHPVVWGTYARLTEEERRIAPTRRWVFT
ncbi:hypothetical protein K2Y11_15135, partial [bacterium]|nr:hypothetical protein [bacterium]